MPFFHFRHENELISATFSPTGTTVLSVADMNTVKLWRVSSGNADVVMDMENDGDITAAFTSAGMAFVLQRQHGRLALWNVEAIHQVWEHRVNCFWGPGLADVSSCGDWLFTIHCGPDCFDAHAADV